jgi:hypothetical protein
VGYDPPQGEGFDLEARGASDVPLSAPGRARPRLGRDPWSRRSGDGRRRGTGSTYLTIAHVSTTTATIEVEIDPEGSQTSYEILLECQSAEQDTSNCGPLSVDPQRVEGLLPAAFGRETVTDPVSGLQPGYLYKYGVIATNATGRGGFKGGGFLTCTGEGCFEPWLPGTPLWVIAGAERSAAEAPGREAEREAAAREAAERRVREAAERAAKERETREAGECVVPHLKGDSLVAAVHALSKTRCVLGRVSRRHGHHGPLVVTRQSAPSGTRLAGGSPVAVTLGARPKR